MHSRMSLEVVLLALTLLGTSVIQGEEAESCEQGNQITFNAVYIRRKLW